MLLLKIGSKTSLRNCDITVCTKLSVNILSLGKTYSVVLYLINLDLALTLATVLTDTLFVALADVENDLLNKVLLTYFCY